MAQYLTEELLKQYLINHFGASNIKDQYRLQGNYRVDYVIENVSFNFETNVPTPNINIAVEFDGYQHYQSTAVIKRDIKKHILLNDMGFHVIHIPYFLQAADVFPFYFNTTTPKSFYGDIDPTYQNGFVDSKCIHPIDFSIPGWMRFIYEFRQYPTPVRDEIYETFNDFEKELYSKMSSLYGEEAEELYDGINWVTHCMWG